MAYNQWLSKIRSMPYWNTSVFSSTVTDFVLIYESVTSCTATASNEDCLTKESFKVKFKLPPTASRSVCLGIKHSSWA
jgi:hypothetical protein